MKHVTQLETVIDPSEATTIALAIERASSLLLSDGRDGCQVACTLSVPLTGTLGILLHVKAVGPKAAITPPF
jgi:predicted nucleic acid-binding protein